MNSELIHSVNISKNGTQYRATFCAITERGDTHFEAALSRRTPASSRVVVISAGYKEGPVDEEYTKLVELFNSFDAVEARYLEARDYEDEALSFYDV